MITDTELITVLENVLHGGADKAQPITMDTQLMGAMPEFDSMAVVSILTQLEDDHDVFIEDDELDAGVFESVRTLHEFVNRNS